MLWLKSCPKCKGDVFEESDRFGRYLACAQCGRYLTAAEEAVLKTRGQVLSARRTDDVAAAR